jgi:hypothetical protein
LEVFKKFIIDIGLLFGEVVGYKFGNDGLDVSDVHLEVG